MDVKIEGRKSYLRNLIYLVTIKNSWDGTYQPGVKNINREIKLGISFKNKGNWKLV